MRFLFLVWSLLIFSCYAHAQNFSGTYTGTADGGAVTLTLNQQGQKVTGTIVDPTVKMQLEGEVKDGQVIGIGAANGQQVLFRIRRQAAGVIFDFMGVTEGGEIMPDPVMSVALAARPASPKPPAKAVIKPAVKPQPKSKPKKAVTSATGSTPNTGRSYRHPSGFALRYPAGWKLNTDIIPIELLPPGTSLTRNKTEYFTLLVNPTLGTGAVNDPRLLQQLKAAAATSFPFLRQVGSTQQIRTAAGGIGSLLTWEGTNPQGQLMRARMFSLVSGKLAFSFFAIATKSRMANLDTALRSIFTSLTSGQPLRDSKLAGVWYFSKTSSNSGGGFSFATQVQREFSLRADGSFTFTTSSRVVGGSADVGGDTGQQPTTTSGRWFAGQNHLYTLSAQGEIFEEQFYRVGGIPGNRTLTVDNQTYREVN